MIRIGTGLWPLRANRPGSRPLARRRLMDAKPASFATDTSAHRGRVRTIPGEPRGIRMRLSVLLIAALMAALPAAAGACVADSTAERPHLVELYTAEGCSSCPPAEKWLSSLRDSSNYVGLEYHVDYWDSLGWRDPYADARYTARQRELARRGSRDIVYTPQIAVDGRVWKDWPKPNLPADVGAAPPPLHVEVTPADAIRVHIATTAASLPDSYRAFAALSENGLSSDVKAGENRGKRLDHDQVVRDFAGPLRLPQADAVLKRPSPFDAAKSSVVAFVQDTKTGDVVQVLRVPLATCAR